MTRWVGGRFQQLVSAFRREEEGQALIEWGTIASLIGVAAVTFLTAIGLDVREMYEAIRTAISDGLS